MYLDVLRSLWMDNESWLISKNLIGAACCCIYPPKCVTIKIDCVCEAVVYAQNTIMR